MAVWVKCLTLLKKNNVYLFFERKRKRERERASTSGGGAERERETESEAGSRLELSAQSPPHPPSTRGSNPQTHEIMT